MVYFFMLCSGYGAKEQLNLKNMFCIIAPFFLNKENNNKSNVSGSHHRLTV